MRRLRYAKIVATLGPSSSDETRIRALFEAGADVFRLNFSHGEEREHLARIQAIRRLEAEAGRPIGVLLDLQGPKIRLGRFAGGAAALEIGQKYRFDLSDAPGDGGRAPLPHPEVFAALGPGAMIFLDDGRVRLRVERAGSDFAETVVEAGGRISDRKGVNLPGAVLPLSALTEKDRRDLQFGLDHGVDWIALSFVQRPDDVAELRKLVAGRAAVMSKLEKPAAMTRLEEIIDLSDAIMVARGDLGVELPPEDVPGQQKAIVNACRRAGKPVVVATQMLDSMVHAPTPTRAEASDVATAVYDGADALMLSAETAAGDYPIESTAMMSRIITRVEQDPLYRKFIDAEHPVPEPTSPDAISAAARQVAHTVAAAAIVTYTTSGSTSLRAARERPDVPIIGLTSAIGTARRLSLAWGVHCVHCADVTDFQSMVERAAEIAVRDGFAVPGQRLVITAGVPFGTPGATNVLRIAWVE
ncbi:MAG: pyruvate kinase [Alphaproteobacteria bacterium]|nr:pyruvate kinase [Alphaproteobacteria bacterium]